MCTHTKRDTNMDPRLTTQVPVRKELLREMNFRYKTPYLYRSSRKKTNYKYMIQKKVRKRKSETYRHTNSMQKNIYRTQF